MLPAVSEVTITDLGAERGRWSTLGAMCFQSANCIAWGVLIAVFMLASAAIFSAVFHATRRRRRFRHYVALARQQERASSAPVTLADGPAPETVHAIEVHAERRAARDWQEGIRDGQAVNPYAVGTPEQVIWWASYQLALIALAESEAGDIIELSR